MFFELEDARGDPEVYREYIAERPSSSGPSRRFRSRRRCRSSPKSATASRSSPSSPAGRVRSTRASARCKPFRDVGAGRRRARRGRCPIRRSTRAFDAGPARAAALLEGQLRQEAHRRGHRRARGARTEGAGASLDHAHLPDQRCLPARGRGRDRVRPPRRKLRDRHRRDVAGPGNNEANIKWVRDYYDATAPLSEAGGYINFMADDDQDRVKSNYGRNYSRLAEVKRRTTRTTSSASTRTSSRPEGRHRGQRRLSEPETSGAQGRSA